MAIMSALIVTETFLVPAWFIHRLGIVEEQGVVRPLGAPKLKRRHQACSQDFLWGGGVYLKNWDQIMNVLNDTLC